MDMVRQVDPDVDATTWASRVATRRAFTSGTQGNVINSVNTAMDHAGHLLDQFEKLGNWSLGESVNQPANYLMRKFGQGAAVRTAEGTIDALAAEARKIYAGAGGGSLSELNEWKKSFPINGSISEQRGALENFVELLDGKLHALSTQYNRGMGTSLEPFQMLDEKPRALYKKLLDREPSDSTGYQTGNAQRGAMIGGVMGGPIGAAAGSSIGGAIDAGKALTTPRAIAPADPSAREEGKTYPLPNGKRGIWRGTGWELVP